MPANVGFKEEVVIRSGIGRGERERKNKERREI